MSYQVWFQLGNSMFPGGHQRISSTDVKTDEQLRRAIEDWRAAAAAR